MRNSDLLKKYILTHLPCKCNIKGAKSVKDYKVKSLKTAIVTDIDNNTGVCTDVIIRSYRAVGIDLQQLVHEDMIANFEEYPSKQIWGLTKPDSNIDHRRVPNLQIFFERNGEKLDITFNPDDYYPGDIVVWGGFRNGSSPWHIGIVVRGNSIMTGNPFVVHNIGYGPEKEDMLFDFPIIRHYRYYPEV